MTINTLNRICVIGGGPAGLAAALAVAARGRRVTVLAADLAAAADAAGASVRDTRTTAILGDGITLLQNLGVWERMAAAAAPLAAIRIVDDRGGWLAGPEVLFPASELGRANFGYNVPNDALVAALGARASAEPRIEMIATTGVTEVRPGPQSVALTTAEGKRFDARLVIAADGRRSIARTAAGIAARDWNYDQVAIATSFGHGAPHDGVSTELHGRAGPLTTVPLPDDADGPRSSLVWIETPQTARRLMAMADAAFATELQHRLRGLLGRVGAVGRRSTFPIGGLMAVAAGRNRIVLAGEAAHVVPPIGAQGLNLGLRDAATIADVIAEHGATDPGAADVTAAYARARAADLVSREIGIDLLNRSLLTEFAPVQALRGLGLHALANSRMLRRVVMQMGIAAPGTSPSLMRSLANAR